MTDRPRVDQLTDDMLDQLYAERDTYRDAWHSAKDRARKHHTRAEKAEAELAALKAVIIGYCPHCGRGDCSPTADQWYEQRQRADRAEAAIARVHALHERYRSALTDDFDCCSECNRTANDLVPFPCATLRALDGTA